jgi:hypothetical protein
MTFCLTAFTDHDDRPIAAWADFMTRTAAEVVPLRAAG